ncbi:MAG: hypothetical protein IIX02_03525, partial [Clostridia bacterium]|nr:hypothetical protein [Clostridia bacterium]
MAKQVKEQNKDKLQTGAIAAPKKRISTKVKNPMGTSFDTVKAEKTLSAPASKRTDVKQRRGAVTQARGNAAKATEKRARAAKSAQDKPLTIEKQPRAKRIASPKQSNKNFEPTLISQTADFSAR